MFKQFQQCIQGSAELVISSTSTNFSKKNFMILSKGRYCKEAYISVG